MIRLIDIMMHNSSVPHKFKQALQETKIIVADNVADYYWRISDQEYWDLQVDFPNIAPPFQNFFVEFKHPAYIQSREFGRRDFPKGIGGCMLSGLDYSIETHHALGQYLQTTEFYRFEEGHTPRWMLVASPIVYHHDMGLLHETLLMMMFINKDGKVMKLHNPDDPKDVMIYKVIGLNKRITSNHELELMTEELRPFVQVALLTVCFMHCKNVELRQVNPPPKLVKAHARRSGLKLHQYHEIQIEPMAKIIKQVSNAQGVGISQAMHICRGHFKTYRGRGLFGKHTGTFWWGQTVRGSAELGQIDSSYNVKELKGVVQ